MNNSENNSETAIQDTIQNYVHGYLNAEGEQLAGAFHPETRLLSTHEGKLERTEMSDWLVNVRARKQNGDIRPGTYEVAFVDVSGDSAVAKVVLTLPKMRFTDYLSLLRVDGSWRIAGKIYTVN